MDAKIIVLEEGQIEAIVNTAVNKAVVEFKELLKKKDKKYLTRRETSRLIGVSYPTLQKYNKEGSLKPFKVGGKILYDSEAVDFFIKNQRGWATSTSTSNYATHVNSDV